MRRGRPVSVSIELHVLHCAAGVADNRDKKNMQEPALLSGRLLGSYSAARTLEKRLLQLSDGRRNP